MHGKLDYGPFKPKEEYIRRRHALVVGKMPTEAVSLKINYKLGDKGKKGKNQTKNYNFGDLKYDLDHGYLKVVQFTPQARQTAQDNPVDAQCQVHHTGRWIIRLKLTISGGVERRLHLPPGLNCI